MAALSQPKCPLSPALITVDGGFRGYQEYRRGIVTPLIFGSPFCYTAQKMGLRPTG